MTATVSVVVPAYNRATLVGDAVDSCLAQRSGELAVQVIAVDDGSSDSTLDVLHAFGGQIRIIALGRNSGRNRARNTGLAAATGDYVKFLDSDDVLVAGSLATEVWTAQHQHADIVVSGWEEAELGDTSGETAVRWPAPRFEPGADAVIDALLVGRAVPTGAGLYARELAQSMLWDEGMRKLDDWDWFVRAALRARRIVSASVSSYRWRSHPQQGIRFDTLLNNAMEHHRVLHKLEHWLRERGQLNEARRKRLAQYYYKELRVLSLHDRVRFEAAVRHILALDPSFAPRDEESQLPMRLIARAIGFRRAVLAHSAIKRTVRRWQGRPVT